MTRARRSHPPTVLKLVERTLKTECALPKGARILLGVSGGGDSQALLHALARLRERLDFELFAHGVDHGLRKEAALELDLAEELARAHVVPFQRSRIAVSPGGNLMARARAARYRELRRVRDAAGAELLATAHHADDRAETFLLRLLRGSGPRGLAVLPPRTGDLLRPLIRARRTDVQAHLGRHAIRFASDPSNDDPRFARTRVRNELLPQMESLSPRVVEHLNALADQLAQESPPELLGPDGTAIPLGRAQTRAFVRLLGNPDAHAQIWLAGGLAIRLDPSSGAPQIVGATPRGAANRRKSD
ncbi:MAG: tRNA lysidine(34) synthetase TilS [Myxococcales bacterium]|nr:tRNA lysidine(34) synthetase TilS [Myxococcales bacterium]